MAMQTKALTDLMNVYHASPAWAFDAQGLVAEYTAGAPIPYYENGVDVGVCVHEPFVNVLDNSNDTVYTGSSGSENHAIRPGIGGLTGAVGWDQAGTTVRYVNKVPPVSVSVFDDVYCFHALVKFDDGSEPTFTALAEAGESVTTLSFDAPDSSVPTSEIVYRHHIGNGVYHVIVRQLQAGAFSEMVARQEGTTAAPAKAVTLQIFCLTKGSGFAPVFPLSQGTTASIARTYLTSKAGTIDSGHTTKAGQINVRVKAFNIAGSSLDEYGGVFNISQGGNYRINFGWRYFSKPGGLYGQAFGVHDQEAPNYNGVGYAPMGEWVTLGVRWSTTGCAFLVDGAVRHASPAGGDYITGTSRTDVLLGAGITAGRCINGVIQSFDYQTWD